MIHEIEGRNVHQMFPKAMEYMLQHGKGNPSRNGTVLALTEPCILVYRRPKERVIFHPERNANPFFHLMECLWMMAGRNDVEFPARYVTTMRKYSDDGVTFNGAYGHRWREHFGKDQLDLVVKALKRDKNDRRALIGMWDASHDLALDSKDLPCNVMVVPRIVDNALDITVFNRSNDIVWGALGANAVHMSFLHEWLAIAIGVEVGRYFQISTNMHLYVEQHISLAESMAGQDTLCPYEVEGFVPFPIMQSSPEQWYRDLAMLLDEGSRAIGIKEPFFRRVAMPMMDAWEGYKNGDFAVALRDAYNIADPAWQKACREWLERARYKRARLARAQDDGVNYED